MANEVYQQDQYEDGGEKTPDILTTALKQFKIAAEYESINRTKMLEDLRFREGDQWDAKVAQERKLDRRPTLTINRLPGIVDGIVNDIKLNRPRIKTRPIGGTADINFSRTMNGIIRHIESESDAQSAYDNAIDYQVSCGTGFFRIVTDYENPEVFDQEIRIRPIGNPFSVYFDPRPFDVDKTFAEWCFVTEWIPRDEFSRRFPNVDMGAFPEVGKGDSQGWMDKERIRIAEYFVREEETREIALLSNGAVVKAEEVSQALAELNAPNPLIPGPREEVTLIKTKQAKYHQVYRYLICASEILEDKKEFPSSFIPVIPVYGKQLIVDHKKEIRGVLRFAKDPQRMYNYWRSAESETVGNQPKTPYIGTTKQFEGHEQKWKDSNKKNQAYLPYNPDPQAPGAPERQPPPQVAPGFFQGSQSAIEDIKATSSMYDPNLGVPGNERTGKALHARQERGDMVNFTYIDNFVKSLRLCGRVLLDMIPRVYDTPRTFSTVNEEGREEKLQLNALGDMNGMPTIINDVTTARFGVVIDTGPSYATLRQEAAENIFKFAQYFPQSVPLIMDLAARMQDWALADEIADRLAKTVPPGIKKGDPPPPPPPPDPEVEEQKVRVVIQQIRAFTEKIKAMIALAKLDEQKGKSNAEQRRQILEILAEAFTEGPMPEGGERQNVPPIT